MAAKKKAAPKKAAPKKTVTKKAAPKKAAAKKPAAEKAANKPVSLKPIKVTADVEKFVGQEPQWEGVELTEKNRQSKLINSFNWYNYLCDAKEALGFINDYLRYNERMDEMKAFKKVGEDDIKNSYGWLARMTLMGWPISEEESARLDAAIAEAIANSAKAKAKDAEEEVAAVEQPKKPTIQDRMREKTAETGGEVAGMLDDYIAAGAKAKHDFAPINILKAANLLPQHIAGEVAYWEGVRAEFEEAAAGKDAQLVEGYNHLTKTQLKNLVKFVETIIADYNGYVAFKKAAKAPRKRKVKTPAQLAAKVKYMPTFDELKLVSEKPEKMVEAKEVYVYDTKKRKLQYYIADEYAGVLTIKGNALIGFDVAKSVQKTLRKPAEQLKEFLAASRPNTRKIFEKTKSVETKLSGRFNENIVILKVW